MLQIQDAHLTIITWQSVFILLSVSVVTGILSGFYPAVLVSAFWPANMISGRAGSLSLSFGLRKLLIVVQFTTSVILIIATIITESQLHYINQLNVSFNKEHLLYLPNASFQSPGGAQAFKHTLLSNKNITGVSMAASLQIGKNYGSTLSMTGDETIDSVSGKMKEWNFAFISADSDFIKTMQIPILQGRDFSSAFANDLFDSDKALDSLRKRHHNITQEEDDYLTTARSIIITKKTAELIHLKKPYVGQIVHLSALQGTVVGIIDDFKGLSIKQKNPAIVLRVAENEWGDTYIRVRTDDIPNTIKFIEKIWKEFGQSRSFSFVFVDEQVQRMYDSEQRLASVFGIFATLAIGIACLGLFSLVALAVQQRTKEIGIQKVLGASVKSIIQLLSVDFIKLVIVSIVIASPIVWWAMNKWLQDYESRIDIGWWIFALAGGLSVIIAFATISIQALRAAIANPVKSLRTE